MTANRRTSRSLCALALLAAAACTDALVAPTMSGDAPEGIVVDAAAVTRVQGAVLTLTSDAFGREIIRELQAEGVTRAFSEAYWSADRGDVLGVFEALERGRVSLDARVDPDLDEGLLHAALTLILDDAIARMEPSVAEARGVVLRHES